MTVEALGRDEMRARFLREARTAAAHAQGIELQPDFPGAFYHLGRALLQPGRNEEAREAFEHSMELNPNFSAGPLGMAQYHLAVGNYDEAWDAVEYNGRGQRDDPVLRGVDPRRRR